MIPEEKKHCAECGTELEEEATVCSKCGCPVEEEKPVTPVAPQQVEVTGVKVTQKSKKMIGIAVAIIVILIAGIFGVQQVQKQNAAKEAARISQEYGENIELATFTMLSGVADAERCCNLIKSVWYNAIFEERDTKTDAYTRPKGNWVSDFNEALGNLFADSSFQTKISNIESNQSTVQSLMKDLKNPPEEYEDAYAAISKLYDAYTKLTNLAVNPTGSLQTFSQNFSDADTETLICYSAMELYLE